MIVPGPATRIFLAPAPTDLRRSFDGLHGLVRSQLAEDPRSGHLFLFCNKPRHQPASSIPIRHRSHRLPVASPARATTTRGPSKGAERERGH